MCNFDAKRAIGTQIQEICARQGFEEVSGYDKQVCRELLVFWTDATLRIFVSFWVV